ncbi:hypothetical protein MKK88_03355 [Methylobacterium sp. E-005]|uniref:hypothetical protein n=1 Tax=Methylobacterium sp. E-005 TaxID=2836549 RepID=UPI001FBA4A75|nr:hypothetical protein [Methylobacterium sp. E-005]MCJ2085033.1 hypothetical protein [Methylobacterium sp. E-005]
MSLPTLDSEALDGSCFAVARALLWQRGPVSVEPIKELASALARTAREHAEYLTGQQYDPNIVTRALEYLERHHAMPTGDAEVWSKATLEILVELACCNTGPSAASEPFYRDIEAGLARARAGYSSA